MTTTVYFDPDTQGNPDYSRGWTRAQQPGQIEGSREDYQIWLAANQPPPQPSWAAFIDALDGDARDIVLGQTRGNLIVDRLIRLENGRTQWREAEDKLIADWNFEPPSLTEEQRTDLQAIADAHDIPLVIGSNNLLSAR